MNDGKQNNFKNEVTTKSDVVISGFGPVGAALAVYLGKLGVSVIVIEKNPDILQMPRAIALDNEALRVLQQIGLSEDSFEKIIIEKVRMYCPYVGKFAEINTAGSIDELPKLVTFYQPDLEQALRTQLKQYEHVHVMLETEFLNFEQQHNAVEIRLKRADGEIQKIQTQYLVGADGASSQIRSAISMDFKGESYVEDWLIVDVKNREGKAIDHIEFICDPVRPAPHMPAPGGRERWEFMLQANETREEMEHPDKIKQLLKPWLDGQPVEIERQAVYRFHARCCDHFQQGRVFLAGDAAHITPPFVGQGLVAGLRDIANLGWKLKWALQMQPGSDNAAQLLASYDLERRPHAKKMIQLAKGMGMLVMPKNKIKAAAVHGLMKSLFKFPLTKPYLSELKVKPLIQYKQGFFLGDKNEKKTGTFTFLPGKQINQVALHNELAQSFKSDDCWGESFSLIVLGAHAQEVISAELAQQWRNIGGAIHSVSRPDLNIASAFVDIKREWLKSEGQSCALILRPDGIVYSASAVDQIERSLKKCMQQLK